MDTQIYFCTSSTNKIYERLHHYIQEHNRTQNDNHTQTDEKSSTINIWSNAKLRATIWKRSQNVHEILKSIRSKKINTFKKKIKAKKMFHPRQCRRIRQNLACKYYCPLHENLVKPLQLVEKLSFRMITSCETNNDEYMHTNGT